MLRIEPNFLRLGSFVHFPRFASLFRTQFLHRPQVFFAPRPDLAPYHSCPRLPSALARPSTSSANPSCPLAFFLPCRSVSSVVNSSIASPGFAIGRDQHPRAAQDPLYSIRSTKTPNQLHKSFQIQQIPSRFGRPEPQTQNDKTRTASAFFSSRSPGESRQP